MQKDFHIYLFIYIADKSIFLFELTANLTQTNGVKRKLTIEELVPFLIIVCYVSLILHSLSSATSFERFTPWFYYMHYFCSTWVVCAEINKITPGLSHIQNLIRLIESYL